MTAHEARQALERADRTLSAVIERLVRKPCEVWQSYPRLQEVAETLVAVRDNSPRLIVDESLHSLIARIQAHSSRALALLDSAAKFYVACNAVAACQERLYRPDGELQPVSIGAYPGITFNA